MMVTLETGVKRLCCQRAMMRKRLLTITILSLHQLMMKAPPFQPQELQERNENITVKDGSAVEFLKTMDISGGDRSRRNSEISDTGYGCRL